MNIRTALISTVLALVVVAGIGFYFFKGSESLESTQIFERAPEPEIVVSEEAAFEFEIADTEAKRIQGLSGRREVPSNYGLLFVFDQKDRYGFWMKDMYVPIDIIWLSETGEVVGIEAAVSPHSYPAVFYPPVPVQYVLETKAYEARAQGWEVGSVIALPR